MDGKEKKSARPNLPNTIGLSHGVISMDLQKGFPLLTTKKMYWKGIIHELLWFLRGDTNIKYLVDNNVHIWDQDAYRWYKKVIQNPTSDLMADHKKDPLEFDRFVYLIKHMQLESLSVSDSYILGDLGKVYGYQWRNQNGVDQVKEVYESLKKDPYSRYHIIDAWNKADFKDMALPPCHLLYQFIVRPLTKEERLDLLYVKGQPSHVYANTPDDDDDLQNIPKFYLDLNMYQRSCDTFLGVPFNLASMSLLLLLFAKATNMFPGVATWIGGDTHLYVDHIPMVKEQLDRQPKKLPRLLIYKDLNSLEDIMGLTIADFELKDYDPYPAIKAKLFTGLKKGNI